MPLSDADLRMLTRRGGESSTLDYKRVPPKPEEFAKLMVAFANGSGGRILIGVDDSGQIVGYNDTKFEEWVASIARDKVDPPLLPTVESHNLAEGHVFVVDVPLGTDKPYARVHDNRRNHFVRVGTTVREPSTEELRGLFLASGRFHADELPVRGTSALDIEGPALYTFARDVHRKDLAAMKPEIRRTWLTNVGYLRSAEGPATLAGILLFGEAPEGAVPECGIVLGRFSGQEAVASTLLDRQVFAGRLPTLIDNSVKAILAAIESRTRRQEGRLVAEPEVPVRALREALINAVVHRDYSLKARQVRVFSFFLIASKSEARGFRPTL